MDVQVRDARPGDADVIADFNVRMAMETENKALDPATVRRGARAVFENASHGRYIVAEIDGRVVGQCLVTYEWSEWRCGQFWWIHSVYVPPEFRGRGVFRSVYRHVEGLARSRPDVCGLRLYVEEHNQRAISTYRGLGMGPGGYVVYEVDWSAKRPSGEGH